MAVFVVFLLSQSWKHRNFLGCFYTCWHRYPVMLKGTLSVSIWLLAIKGLKWTQMLPSLMQHFAKCLRLNSFSWLMGAQTPPNEVTPGERGTFTCPPANLIPWISASPANMELQLLFAPGVSLHIILSLMTHSKRVFVETCWGPHTAAPVRFLILCQRLSRCFARKSNHLLL